jgi:hypothetical protein
MPFKHLSAPKAIASLKAEVCSAAQLEPKTLLGVLTTDPVSLSLHDASSGSSGKGTNVSLNSANEVAFINRDVAVVRSGDDLWALLDIQHRAKMDQVGRDIRSLHACPKGETALAIGWDGQAAQLELRQHEVGGRQFTLRGEIRTCDLGLNECYVVVAGAGGGQFRVHPGLTPESGASARIDLPAEAQSFDQLRAGKELSVLYKKRGTQVCVILRDGKGNLSAKMVALDTAAVGVAVIATSLFTVGADAKVRLFNGDTLNRAGADAPMTPLATAQLTARGEPTMMTTTTKANARLWIGTKAGDLIRVEATKAGLGDLAGMA